jgi:hypothetical protein
MGLGVAIVGGVFAYLWRTAAESSAEATPAGNQPPRMKSVRLEQTRHGIVAHLSAIDPDRDPISYAIYWTVDRRRIPGAKGNRLQAKFYRPGNLVQVHVTPTDPYARGVEMLSQPMTIGRGASPGGADRGPTATAGQQ